MHIPQIHVTRLGLLVKGTGADFPELAPLECFGLKPLGLARNMAAKLDAVKVVGRVS